MIPGDAIPVFIDPADLALAFGQNLALAHAGPGLALLVIGLVLGLVVLVLALAALEPRGSDEGAERVLETIQPLAQAPLLPACAADELASLATLKIAMLGYVEQRDAGQ
jgi:hypothetical protein